MQEEHRRAKATELHEHQENGHSHPQQREEFARTSTSSPQQQISMSADLVLDLEHDFGSISATDHYLGDSDLLLSPEMCSACLDTAADSYFETGLRNGFAEQYYPHAHIESLKDSNVFSGQVSKCSDAG